MPNKINVTILALSIGILQVFQGFTTAKVLSINRNRRGQPWINKDSFSIPSSLCLQNNGHDECEPFRALNDKHQNCSCYCPSQNSSFVYHSNGWTCLQNGRVRDLQGKRIRQLRIAVLISLLIYLDGMWNIWFCLYCLYGLSCSGILSGRTIINIIIVPPIQIRTERLNWANRGSNIKTEILRCLDFDLFRETETFRDLVLIGNTRKASKNDKYSTLHFLKITLDCGRLI